MNQTIVIGGGQAGLAAGYFLAKHGLRFQILDANQRVGDSWRKRYDSLKLFTTARYIGLPGFPYTGNDFPTKDEMADYLESYAKHFDLPIRNEVKVDSVTRNGKQFVITAGDRTYNADQVVVAMSNYQVPKVPSFAKDLNPNIVQLHSTEYRNPSQLKPGAVLVVGVGNSGGDIALELAVHQETFLAGKEAGVIPFRIETFLGRNVLARIVRFIFDRIISIDTPIGRKLRPKMLHKSAPLVRVKPKDLLDAGVKRVGRVSGVQNGIPVLDNGQLLDVQNVIWCTGFGPSFSWIQLPVFDETGDPEHERGVASNVPGLYFLGLHFLRAMSSATLMGIGTDAKYIASQIKARVNLLLLRVSGEISTTQTELPLAR